MTDGLAFTNVVMRPRRPSRAPKLPWGKRGRSPRRPFFVQNRSDARLLFMHMSALGLESAYPCAAHEREKITGAPVPLCSPPEFCTSWRLSPRGAECASGAVSNLILCSAADRRHSSKLHSGLWPL